MNKWLKRTIYALLGIGAVYAATLGGTETEKVSFTETIYTRNSEKFQTFDIPDSAVSAKVSITREAWPEKGDGLGGIQVITEVFDDKISWGNHCGFATDGGDRLDEKGQLATESYNDCNLYPGTNRKIKVTVKSRDDLSTQASITFTKITPTILGMFSPKVAQAAIAHVQSSAGGNQCGSVTDCVVSYPGNTTAASLLVGTCRYASGGRTITYSDTQTNSYALADEHIEVNDSNGTLIVYYAMNTAGGTTDATTCHISGTALTMRATVGEYSGVALTSALDQAVSAEGSGLSLASGALTPNQNGSLLFVATFEGGTTSVLPGTDFTTRSTVPDAVSVRIATEDYIQPTAASHDGTMTQAANQVWAAVLVVFKPPAAGGGTPSYSNEFVPPW